ncbi:Calcium/calmodulin-dependent protein kinase type II subunit alpha [Phytophthora cinnamomi]|nr:Calcium/calmodulin-dependent protein kinase type II subunit alpha [Phytophthora cinnamomi]
MKRQCNSLPRHNVPFRCDDAQEFVNFRVQAHIKSQAALAPSFKLPNVGEKEDPPRDGIVMVVYPKLLASAYAAVRVLREVLDCRLPVEIWFRPDEIHPDDVMLKPLRHLAAMQGNVTFQEIHDPMATRFVAKIHAIYHSTFDRLLFLDADNVPHKLTGTFTDEAKEESLHEKTVDAVEVVSAPVERYADPAIWTHLMRFHKGSSRRYYSIQTFVLDFEFEQNQKCYGRQDVHRNPHFYIQEIAALDFSGLETQLRRFALESTQFSPQS